MSVYDSLDAAKVLRRAKFYNRFRAPLPVLRSLLMGTFDNVSKVYREGKAEPSTFTGSRRRLTTPEDKQGELTTDMLVPTDSPCSAFAGKAVRDVFERPHDAIDSYIGFGVLKDRQGTRVITSQKVDTSANLPQAYKLITEEAVRFYCVPSVLECAIITPSLTC